MPPNPNSRLRKKIPHRPHSNARCEPHKAWIVVNPTVIAASRAAGHRPCTRHFNCCFEGAVEQRAAVPPEYLCVTSNASPDYHLNLPRAWRGRPVCACATVTPTLLCDPELQKRVQGALVATSVHYRKKWVRQPLQCMLRRLQQAPDRQRRALRCQVCSCSASTQTKTERAPARALNATTHPWQLTDATAPNAPQPAHAPCAALGRRLGQSTATARQPASQPQRRSPQQIR
ncbi:hypothetical protein COO60DRAFT_1482735, partial [Scenedesmus sp. NREL 46B-D3]